MDNKLKRTTHLKIGITIISLAKQIKVVAPTVFEALILAPLLGQVIMSMLP